MATRSLTEAFILMRNNALQNKHLFADHVSDDHAALVSRDETDIELGNTIIHNGFLAPQWSDKIDEIRQELGKINFKMKTLSDLHDKHLNRPTMDDSIAEENEIENLINEITRMFHQCHRLIQQFNGLSRLSTGKEFQLCQNMASTVARSLQELSTSFRSSQSSYLKKLQGREERHNQYLLSDTLPFDFQTDTNVDFRFTSIQMQAIEEDSLMVEQREKEIVQIVKSIQDLNDIFKELAVMIVDQGTILDRVDFNIEKSSQQIESGLVQLQKAEKYQKKNRKMYIVASLFALIVLLLIVLIAVKS